MEASVTHSALSNLIDEKEEEEEVEEGEYHYDQMALNDALHQVQQRDDVSVLTEESSANNSIANPRIGLLHCGTWIPKEYKVGRHIKGTGIWNCCGSAVKLSLYCPSEESRQKFIQDSESLALQANKDKEYAKFVKETRRIPWEKGETGDQMLTVESQEDKILRDSNSIDNSYNILMLVSWTFKHRDDLTMVLKALKLMLAHSKTGDGCFQLIRHRGLKCLFSCSQLYEKNSEVQLLVLAIIHQLLDCNITRDLLVEDINVLTLAFNLGYYHMTSVSHLKHSLCSMLQCCRSEVCREVIFSRNYLRYCILYCQKFPKNPDIIRPILKMFNWVTSTNDRCVAVYNIGGCHAALKCMEKHLQNPDILAPAMFFLTRLSKIYPPAIEYIVKRGAVHIVVDALKSLYSNEVLQLEGLKLIHALSKSPAGWKQISEIRDGWTSITQGTTSGNALIHDLPGGFHNPGWVLGETPHLPQLDRNKLAAAKVAAAKNAVIPKAAWTSHSLRQYMGLSMKPQTLGINVDEHNVYFEIVSSLDLLPYPGEEREYWHIRIKEYEKENEILIMDMVSAVLEMKTKEIKEEKTALKAKKDEEYIKPVYVMGKLISTKALEESDVAVTTQLEGVL